MSASVAQSVRLSVGDQTQPLHSTVASSELRKNMCDERRALNPRSCLGIPTTYHYHELSMEERDAVCHISIEGRASFTWHFTCCI